MIEIKKAKLKDVDLIVKLWKEFMTYLATDMNPEKIKNLKPFFEKKKNAEEIFKTYIKKCIRSKNYLLNIAYVDGKPAGYSFLEIKNTIPIFKIEKTGCFNDLFVKKQFRGLKISSKFKEIALKWFKEKGIKNMSISVYSGNEKARDIYKYWGFDDYHIEMRRKI